MAVARATRDTWGADGAIIEIHVDHLSFQSVVRPMPMLVVVEAPSAGWAVPDGLRWRDLAEPDPGVPTPLRTRLAELLAERRALVDVPVLRAPWSRVGWHARATAWVLDRLAERGRSPTGPIEQVRHWGISALMRVETAAGRVWFKAVFPSFGHEPAVSALLHREARGAVAPVLAIDDDEGWMLLDDVGSDVVLDHPDADAATVRGLVSLQRAFVDRHHDLRQIGCPRRPFAALPDQLATIFADPLTSEWIELVPARAAAIVEWTAQAADDVATLPFPDTLVHGDFHPRNAVVLDGRPVIFDWSDAAVAHPLVDALTWSSWLRDDTDRADRTWHVFLDAWADVCPVDRIEPLRRQLVGLAAGYHTVSYHGIVAGMEPVRRPEMTGGLQGYFTRLDGAVPQ